MKQVAIIIPAYKQDYFERTLMALSNQTNKCFNVYIGDDNSPYDLEKIYLNYFNKLNGVYKRFDDNLGGTNLVAHWNRCLEMVGDEEWIWLFSDDDILDENCVQNFYNEIAISEEHYDVYHFDVNVIGESDELLSAQKPFPKVLKVEDFILQRSAGTIKSYVVEYIFNRSIFKKLGGFVNFPTAWHSDEATVIFGATKSGIKSIRGGRVNWRASEFNITPNSKTKRIVLQKVEASIEFSSWLRKYMDTNDIQLSVKMSYYLLKRFSYELHLYRECISVTNRVGLLKKYADNLRLGRYYPISLLFLLKFSILNSR